jgi:hypothetical protein
MNSDNQLDDVQEDDSDAINRYLEGAIHKTESDDLGGLDDIDIKEE